MTALPIMRNPTVNLIVLTAFMCVLKVTGFVIIDHRSPIPLTTNAVNLVNRHWIRAKMEKGDSGRTNGRGLFHSQRFERNRHYRNRSGTILTGECYRDDHGATQSTIAGSRDTSWTIHQVRMEKRRVWYL